MNPLHWFGITATFHCQVCNQKSVEKLVISNDRENPGDINKYLHENIALMCKKCGLPIVVGSDVLFHALPGTPEQLKENGYPVPPQAFSRPSTQN
jgi:hypothetical protein